MATDPDLPAPPDPDAAGLIPTDTTEGVDQTATPAEAELQANLAAELSDDAIRPGETLHAWRDRIAHGDG